MVKMAQPELNSLLEECLIQLQAGNSVKEILAQYPNYAQELRPLLETAAGMRYNQSNIIPPTEAMIRSRRLFVTQLTMQARRQSIFHSIHLRLAVSMTIVILLVVGLLSTGLGSAAALPGDTLYPVKIALEQVQLNLAAGPAQRLQLLENFDQVRAQEVNQLKTTDRMITVTFSGVPSQSKDGWMVSGVKLKVSDSEATRLANWQASVVQVTGETDGQTVNVTNIQPRVLTFSGRIQEITADSWTIDGVDVKLDSSTKITGTGAAGQQVDISAQQQENGQLIALNIDVHNENNNPISRRSPVVDETSQNPVSTLTTEVEGTKQPRPTGEGHPQATPQPGSENTRVSTGTGERERTNTVQPSQDPNRTSEPSSNQFEHRQTPIVSPSKPSTEKNPTVRSTNQ